MAKSGPTARELLDDGFRYERAGMTDRALDRYQSALATTKNPALVSESLRRLSHVYRGRCEWDRALAAATRSAAAAQDARSPELMAEAWNAEAAVHQSRGDFDAAIPLYSRMLDVLEAGRMRGVALQNLAAIYARRGQFTDAAEHFRQALSAFEAAEDRSGMGYVLTNLAGLALDQGDAARAETVLEDAMTLAREIQDLDLLAIARVNHAEALLARGELQKAEEEASAAFGHFGASENRWRRIECLRLLGEIAVQREQLESARRFFTAALDTAEQVDAKVEREQMRERLAELGQD
ncbi:MAG TPA: tetratricopeptide repeat protein [Longimicrobiales bacterium]